jgi:Skp family chaperone for outer membrane proteins
MTQKLSELRRMNTEDLIEKIKEMDTEYRFCVLRLKKDFQQDISELKKRNDETKKINAKLRKELRLFNKEVRYKILENKQSEQIDNLKREKYRLENRLSKIEHSPISLKNKEEVAKRYNLRNFIRKKLKYYGSELDKIERGVFPT